MTTLQDQPIIIEEKQKASSPQQNHQFQEEVHNQKSTFLSKNYLPQTTQTEFFEIMDTVDEYDRLIKEMNELYTEGMLTIANVKFINPYSSLSTKGFKPTPAVTKVFIQEKKSQEKEGQMFCLVTESKNIKFTNSAIDSINSENRRRLPSESDNLNQNLAEQPESETESHSAHSSLSTNNQLYSYEQEQMIIEEQQIIEECRNLVESGKFQKDEFILQRFNIESQKEIITQGMYKFDQLLIKLLQLAEKKLQINQKYNAVQLQNKQK